MRSPFGPVLNVELIALARRSRFLWLRMVYGSILFLIIWLSYQNNLSGAPEDVSPNRLARFTESTFIVYSVVQLIAVGLLTPAVVAGMIAGERQRRTLSYLLASHLNGFEVIFGKLAARLATVGMYVLMGLPMISILSLFGGLDPLLIVLSFAGALTMGVFLASLTMLVSCLAKRVRDAIFGAYMLILGWITFPYLVMGFFNINSVLLKIYEWIAPANELLVYCNPFRLIAVLAENPRRDLVEVGLVFAGHWAISATVIILAAVLFRPIARSLESGASGTKRIIPRLRGRDKTEKPKRRRPRARLIKRPPCRSRPMLWKELWSGRLSGIIRFITITVGLMILGSIVVQLCFVVPDAAAELIEHGYFNFADRDYDRNTLHIILSVWMLGLFALGMLGTVVSAAGSISNERERDTWISILGTPLTAREIILAKMAGAIWSVRAIWLTIAALWCVGIVCGAVFPFSPLLTTFTMGVYLAYGAALGVNLSLWSKSSIRAQGFAVGILIFTSGGYLLFCLPVISVFSNEASLILMMGFSPLFVFGTLFSVEHVVDPPSWFFDSESIVLVLTYILSMVAHGAAAWGLTYGSIESFARANDRPPD